jgi:hypothetical protein
MAMDVVNDPGRFSGIETAMPYYQLITVFIANRCVRIVTGRIATKLKGS